MTYPLNNFNNSYNQPSMGLGNNSNLQNIDPKKIKTDVQNSNNLVNNTLKDHDQKEKLYVAGASIGSWAVISKLMDKFNAKCRTQIVNGKETSMLHKVQSGADKFGHAIEDTAVSKKVFSGLNKAGSFVKTNIIDKSKILSAMVNTPARPELSMPKMMLNGTLAETAQDAVEAIQKYCANNKVKIDTLGITAEQFEKITKEPAKYIGNLVKICKKLPDGAIEVGSQGVIMKHVLGRKVYPSELVNKLTVLGKKSIIGETKNLSRLGKAVPKMFLRVVEGLTNGTAGGKFAIALQAMCFGDAIVRTFKAPKGEKGKTFAESMVNDLSYYLMMPLGLSMIYGAAGAKYTGMTKTDVQAYRKTLKTLNEKVAAKTISRADYLKEVKGLKTALKGNLKIAQGDGFLKATGRAITNIVNKPVKFLGGILSTGLEKISPYAGKDATILDKFRGSFKTITKTITGIFKKDAKGITIKGTAGGALRFAGYMFLIAPFLAKIMTKGSHLVFGKPTKSILDEDKEPANEQQAQAQAPVAYPAAREFTQQVQKPVLVSEPYVRQNLLDKYKVDTNVQTNPFKAETVQASQVQAKRYIPSTEGVKYQAPDTTKLKSAWTNSITAEKIATRQMNKKY